MERKIQDFIDAVANDEVEHFTTKTPQKAFYADPDKAVAPLVDFMRQQIQQDHLAQAETTVNGTDISVRLELSVINLPLQDTKTIAKIMAVDETAPLNVYAVIETPDINVSGLRIDALAPAQTYVDQAATADASLHDWLKLQIEKLQAAATNAEETDTVKKPTKAKSTKTKATKAKTSKTKTTKAKASK
ncbi:hypothetical protein [Levilactobacillus suantsaii]|uniref:hypothetical protein n=1 Tax=Levilactobacillus suantsaii TaxID=2292255 RepID=UPI001CDCF7EB|nr:hypothetical protein [Levilactobacillus suantsaii]